ncbi:MAG TPA: ROK family protein [Candidatus Limnocylindrales bacterium]|nr:ROK family protein [Candidatus Limnocylindrales bacterium]
MAAIAEAPASAMVRPIPERDGAQLLTVGIDVGGTKTACVVTDSDDQVLMHSVQPTEADRLTGQLSDLVRSAIDHFAADDGRAIAAVGVAVPGYVEPRTGTVGLAVNLGGSDLALGPLLEEAVGLPCYVEHDARAAAAWVHATTNEAAGDSAEQTDMAYLSVGTGISAGIVLDGRVLRGANGLAGEIGHIVGDPAAGRCACGLDGCYEVIAAGPAITRLARQTRAAAPGDHSTLPHDPTAADVFRAAAEGDAIAADLAATVAGRLAHIIRGLVLTLGVNHVVVGGGVAAAGDALLNPLLEAIGRERLASPLVEAAFSRTNIELLSPSVEAGARGAAAIARQRVEADHREGVG